MADNYQLHGMLKESKKMPGIRLRQVRIGSIAYSLRAILAVSQEQMLADGPSLPPLEEEAVQALKGRLDPLTDDERREVESVAGLTVKAMFNAAKSDGQVDRSEVEAALDACLIESDAVRG